MAVDSVAVGGSGAAAGGGSGVAEVGDSGVAAVGGSGEAAVPLSSTASADMFAALQPVHDTHDTAAVPVPATVSLCGHERWTSVVCMEIRTKYGHL